MRPLRDTNPDKLHLITIRTLHAQLLLLPGRELNKIVGGILARYQEQFGILIYAYVVNGNHYHLLVQAPKGNLWQFEQSVNREITKRINRLRCRTGPLWARRYDDLTVTGPGNALEALLYIVCNPTSHGLVSHPKKWPGLSCYNQLVEGEHALEFEFIDYSAFHKALKKSAISGEKVYIEDFTTTYALCISVLPDLEYLEDKKRQEFLRQKIEEQVSSIRGERASRRQGFLGEKKILHQSSFSRPINVKRSPRPACYSKCAAAIHQFKAQQRIILSAYREASRKFRAGDLLVDFPPYTIRPPLHYAASSFC